MMDNRRMNTSADAVFLAGSVPAMIAMAERSGPGRFCLVGAVEKDSGGTYAVVEGVSQSDPCAVGTAIVNDGRGTDIPEGSEDRGLVVVIDCAEEQFAMHFVDRDGVRRPARAVFEDG